MNYSRLPGRHSFQRRFSFQPQGSHRDATELLLPTADEALLWFETLKATGWGVGTAATALDESGLGAAKDKLVIG